MSDLLFKMIAMVTLLVIYGCYFGKMIAQKRKGIQTNQIGKGKVGFVKSTGFERDDHGDDMKKKGIDSLYLITDHTSFYERYGWKFLYMVQEDGEPDMSRMYIHR